MTVGELIDKLSKYPKDMLIALRDDCPGDFDYSYETIDIEHNSGDDEIILVIR